MVISIFFYIFYLILSFIVPLLSLKKVNATSLLISLIFTAQFSVTAFLKVGMTVGFMEVALFLTFIVLIIKLPLKSIRFTAADKVFLVFIVFSLLSVFIAYARVFFQDLNPSKEYDLSPTLRSIMSLNKIIVFLPLFIIIRSLISSQIELKDLQKQFLLILAFSGIVPSLAVVFESLNIGFLLIHNNPSFSETFRIEVFNGARASGLSNEASFFGYQLFFCYMGAIELFFKHPKLKKTMLFIAVFYWITLLVTISRTGILLFLVYTIYKYFETNTLKFKSVVKLSIILVAVFFVLSRITIQNFNLRDRFISSFVFDADLSTIERYGVTQALYKLIVDKGIILGVGIYNYQYYIKPYFPDFMSVIYYARGQSPPSFNFILQLIAELGPIIFIFMFGCVFFILKKADSFIKEWFVFLFLFALGFQVLNFTIPFIILLYPPNNEDSLHSRKY